MLLMAVKVFECSMARRQILKVWPAASTGHSMAQIYTHYDNLKVTRNAPPEVIRAAYKSLSQKFHPDRNPDNRDATRTFQIIKSAYEVLSDPVKRKEHDKWIAMIEAKTQNDADTFNTVQPAAPHRPLKDMFQEIPLVVQALRHYRSSAHGSRSFSRSFSRNFPRSRLNPVHLLTSICLLAAVTLIFFWIVTA
jgi:DnaJ-class molecular chaperone